MFKNSVCARRACQNQTVARIKVCRPFRFLLVIEGTTWSDWSIVVERILKTERNWHVTRGYRSVKRICGRLIVLFDINLMHSLFNWFYFVSTSLYSLRLYLNLDDSILSEVNIWLPYLVFWNSFFPQNLSNNT